MGDEEPIFAMSDVAIEPTINFLLGMDMGNPPLRRFHPASGVCVVANERADGVLIAE